MTDADSIDINSSIPMDEATWEDLSEAFAALRGHMPAAIRDGLEDGCRVARFHDGRHELLLLVETPMDDQGFITQSTLMFMRDENGHLVHLKDGTRISNVDATPIAPNF